MPVTEFRSAVIVGSGSLSFEMIRYLVEGLPIIACPRWIDRRVQPISVRNVLEYLVATLDEPASEGKTLEIGGADVVTYGEMVRGYGIARGLRRRLVLVPVPTSRLAAWWIDLVTPMPASIAAPLLDGLRNESSCGTTGAAHVPEIEPMDYDSRAAGPAALDSGEVETVWCGALVSRPRHREPRSPRSQEGISIERRQRSCSAPPRRTSTAPSPGSAASAAGLGQLGSGGCAVSSTGCIGGVGMRRGRRDPDDVRVGDAVDFWRVEAVEPGRLLRLRAEMKVPGLAWLQFGSSRREDAVDLHPDRVLRAQGCSDGGYWNLLYPLHKMIFRGLARAVVRSAERKR